MYKATKEEYESVTANWTRKAFPKWRSKAFPKPIQLLIAEYAYEKPSPIHLTVKCLNGNKNEMVVEWDATVKDVKMVLQATDGIPSERLRLIFKGKLLYDTDKLKDKGVESGMTVFSAIMIRGG